MASVLYFASLAEVLDIRSEQIDLPSDCATVADLIALLRRRGELFDKALNGETPVLIAVNQDMCGTDTEIENHDEIAFFPPVTGG